MEDHQNHLDYLDQKLETLLKKQEGFAKELMLLYQEIEKLKKIRSERFSEQGDIKADFPEKIKPIGKETKIEAMAEPIPGARPEPIPALERSEKKPNDLKTGRPGTKSNWEKFIGENLINKIGIVITVLGVAIGAKYSIDNNLISPMTRIILGYLAGLGLLGFGIKLKAKYENYSAVLVSGALAILYFITFAAYNFYALFPQLMAFVLMLLFTVFGVVAALNYNKQIIAHFGLVGAYAVPFLLSDDSGNAAVLFGYMAIINLGILAISYKKYWKPLFYSSFIFTWLIYTSWIGFSYETETHFKLALVFLCVFFLIFYATFLTYKLKASEKFKNSDIALVLANSFIFYGFGYGLISHSEMGDRLLGIYTLCNAILHFIVSVVIYRKELADRNLFYLISGLVLVFLTIAIPVQLNGNWVTLLWTSEAALLFWIGRTKNVPFYVYLSYPLMVLAFLSLLHDWEVGYDGYFTVENDLKPLLNRYFMTSILFLAAFGFINWVNNTNIGTSGEKQPRTIARIMAFGIPGIFIFVLFCTFYLEIGHYWDRLFQASEIPPLNEDSLGFPQYNYNLRDLGKIWLLNYSLLFVAVLAFINIGKIKNRSLGLVTLVFGLLGIFVFLTVGLYILSELRESYVDQTLSEFYEITFLNVGMRYVVFAFFGAMLFGMYKLVRQEFMKLDFKIPFEIILHLSALWITSSELLNWMHLAGSGQSYKLGLSILWGMYSLLLIILGIWKNKKYLRVGAIVLFGITLLKLFFYDIASLNTLSKTIVFVSLGILLLIISFLYNKYKNKISDERED